MIRTKEIVELYNKVQKIPYCCLKVRDADLLLKKNKGSCAEKHIFLGQEFKKMGIPVKYLLIKFDWNDLLLPKEIISKKEGKSTLGWHLALRIKPKNKWIIVDATWDPKLKKAGFPITKNWQGLSNTKLAVPPKRIIELKRRPAKRFKVLKNWRFFNTFNKWLESQRK